MSKLYRRFFALVIRLAGGRPDVVLALARGLDRAAQGRSDLLRQQNQRKNQMSVENIRLIMLIIAALGSAVLAMVMLFNPPEQHPPLGVIVLVAAHWLLVGNLVLGQAGPALLADNDAQVLGWWPLSSRELLLAKLAVLLKPALEMTAALGTVPLLIYLFTGKPMVLAALIFAAGLLLQAVGVTAGITVLLAGTVRLFGRRKAERLAGLVADGNGMPLLFFLWLPLRGNFGWFKEHAWVLFLLPPVWFAAFGDLVAGPRFWLLAGLGLVSTGLLVGFGLRLVIPDRSLAAQEAATSRKSRLDLAGWLTWPLRPWLRGREGWVVRRLLVAHLRDDWRFVGSILMAPLVLVLMVFVMPQPDLDGEDLARLQISAMFSVNLVPFMFFSASMAQMATSFSNQPEPLWQVALADLDGDRILAAARTMVLGMIGLPVLAVYGWQAERVGAPWPIILLDAAIIFVQLGILILFFQFRDCKMPFSTRYQQDQSARRILTGLIMAGILVVFMAVNYAYVAFLPVRIGAWVAWPLAWLTLRLRLRKRVTGRRLSMDVVQD